MVTDNAGFGKRKRHAAVLYDNKMWVMGGTVSDAPRNDVWSSSDGVTWTQATASAPWAKREHLNAAVFDNKMWVVGGEGSGYFGDAWYSTDGAKWTCATSKAQWPARSSSQTIVYNGKMWILGGCNSSMEFTDMWYTADGAKWTQATPLSAPWKSRKSFRSVIFKDKLWVIGGSQEASGWTYYNDVWYYEIPTAIGNNLKQASSAAGLSVMPFTYRSGGPVMIRYYLDKPAYLKTDVYSCTGRKIRSLWNGVQTAGAHELTWNGLNAGGGRVGPGTIFVRFRTGSKEIIRKVVIGGN